MEYIDGVPVWGEPVEEAVGQLKMCYQHLPGAQGALMADHHIGYSMPIGGVVAYPEHVSPSGVGYDIACGNMAVELRTSTDNVLENISEIMDEIYNKISFGLGRKNKTPIDHELFDDDPGWDVGIAKSLKRKAQEQLGTVGSGNHYVDVFISDDNRVWVGVHFGSRGFGHGMATWFIDKAGGKDGMFVPPALIKADSQLGQEYIAAMKLAGRYAYAGREWVCETVVKIIGGLVKESVHNHHNFAWQEKHKGQDYWVVRKGATPAFPGQKSFIGGSMGDYSVIVEGVDSMDAVESLYSTVHGAGRIMSRTQAAGRWRKKQGKIIRTKPGEISREMMDAWLEGFGGVELRGAGCDESPHCYRRLPDVLAHHEKSTKVLRYLRPIGVAMAGDDIYDPYKD